MTDMIFRRLYLAQGKAPEMKCFITADNKVYAVRKGDYKAHFITELCWGNSKTSLLYTDPEIEITGEPTVLDSPLLFNVNVDPSERFNIADQHPGSNY